MIKQSPEARFWSKVEKITDPNHLPSGEYWKWVGNKSKGYGYFWNGSKYMQAYRYVYTLLVGPIPEGLDIDHLCRTKDCVNPKDLEPVTRSINIRRGLASALRVPKTQCPNGHLYTDDNKIMRRYGQYKCRTCKNEQGRLYRLRKKE